LNAKIDTKSRRVIALDQCRNRIARTEMNGEERALIAAWLAAKP
jgi:hypothetical protein